MEKNENYYDYENLGPDTIKFALLDDNNAILKGYNNGELDFIENLPVDEVATYLASGELNIADYIGTYYVCFNTENEVFSDPAIRKAFSLVIDRNYIVDNVTQSGEVPATGYVPSGIYDADGASGDDFRTVGGEYYSVSEDDYEKNCEEARQILADAGYPDGEGFPTVEYLYNTDDKHKKIAEALQKHVAKELGVTVNLGTTRTGTYSFRTEKMVTTRSPVTAGSQTTTILAHSWICGTQTAVTTMLSTLTQTMMQPSMQQKLLPIRKSV